MCSSAEFNKQRVIDTCRSILNSFRIKRIKIKNDYVRSRIRLLREVQNNRGISRYLGSTINIPRKISKDAIWGLTVPEHLSLSYSSLLPQMDRTQNIRRILNMAENSCGDTVRLSKDDVWKIF